MYVIPFYSKLYDLIIPNGMFIPIQMENHLESNINQEVDEPRSRLTKSPKTQSQDLCSVSHGQWAQLQESM